MNLMLAPLTPNKWHGTVVRVSPVPQQTEPAPASLSESEEGAATHRLLAIEEEERSARNSSAANTARQGDSQDRKPNKPYLARTRAMQSEEPDTAAAARKLLARYGKRREPGIGTLKVPAAPLNTQDQATCRSSCRL